MNCRLICHISMEIRHPFFLMQLKAPKHLIDFDAVLANTITSYNPDQHGRSSGKGFGYRTYSAFHAIGRQDQLPIKIRGKMCSNMH